jgi:hypothetical protein
MGGDLDLTMLESTVAELTPHPPSCRMTDLSTETRARPAA